MRLRRTKPTERYYERKLQRRCYGSISSRALTEKSGSDKEHSVKTIQSLASAETKMLCGRAACVSGSETKCGNGVTELHR